MSDNKREQLSALMDGEVDQQESDLLIKHLCQHDATDEKACWERYHLISDVLKKNLPDNLSHDLSARVAAVLEHEPTVLAPRRLSVNWKRYSKPLAGAAIAASVATISIVALRVVLPEMATMNAVATNEQPVPVAVGQPMPAQDFTTVSEPLDTQPQVRINDPAIRLNGYLINHSEFAVPNGIQITPPYSRVVESEQQRK